MNSGTPAARETRAREIPYAADGSAPPEPFPASTSAATRLSTSAGLGWSQLSAAVYRDRPTMDCYETDARADMLVVVATSGTFRVESAKRGRWLGSNCYPGSVGMTAPGNFSTLRWRSAGTAPLESVHVGLRAELLAEVSTGEADHRPVLPDMLHIDDPFLAAAGTTIAGAIASGADALYADALAVAMAAHLVRVGIHRSLPASNKGLSAVLLSRVLTHMRDQLGQPMTVADLAALVHLSPYHFLRLFRVSTGTTPHRYLVDLRMRRGAELLEKTSMAIADVAVTCGYGSASRFGAAFRRHFGLTPSGFRAATWS